MSKPLPPKTVKKYSDIEARIKEMSDAIEYYSRKEYLAEAQGSYADALEARNNLRLIHGGLNELNWVITNEDK